MMKRRMNHLKRLHRMNLSVLNGEENHRKEVSGRLGGEDTVTAAVCVSARVCVCVVRVTH